MEGLENTGQTRNKQEWRDEGWKDWRTQRIKKQAGGEGLRDEVWRD